ncbi:sliding clamp DNA polymerase accessory protein [Salmonella phage 38]|uniref:Sliding clamp DNA polymerase accessory protein n=1 Tax=Salmonella phage 38 TaxID=1654891 RepID=A0A0N7C9J7_9CAUD|nr:sliding clamp DNA polymerase accessory protein [Salmonella phage 38]AKJ73718.1 sliding clamp DNA polymerase accessory protein [Salmonella phage 38]
MRTINDSSTVIAIADIDEDFPFEFPILDLTKLLAIQRLPSFKGGKIEMSEDHILLKGENSQLQFWRSAKELTVVPADSIDLRSVEFETTVTPEKMKELTRACSTLGHKTVRLVASGGKTRLVGTTTTIDNSNDYTVELGETTLGDFAMPVDVVNLKMIEGNYVIRACAEMQLVNFQSADGTINYYVGMQLD